MNVIITHHAASRFQERHAPHFSLDVAKRTLAESFHRAGKLRCRTWAGTEQWRLDDPPCTLVTKRDPGGVIAVVTVLPAREVETDEIVAEWLAEKERRETKAAKRVAKTPATRAANKARAQAAEEANRARRVAHAEAMARSTEAKHAALAAELRRTIDSCEAAVTKAKAHAEETDRQAGGAKRALRFALKAALGVMDLGEALDAVYEIDPGYLSEDFLFFGESGGERAG